MPARIIVPIDGSTFSEDALATAMALLDDGGTLDLVTAVEGAPPFAVPDYDALAREWAMKYLDGVTEKLPPTLTANRQVLVGHPTEQIRLFIEESDADLVVMASHGRGPFTRAWLGSMADALVRTSKKPLLLVHPDTEDEPSYQADLPPRKVLIPLDGSDLAEAAVEGALRMFGRDVEFTLIRVVQSPVGFASPYASPYLPDTINANEELKKAAAQAEDELSAAVRKYEERATSVKAETITSEHVSRAILEHAEATGVDAIAIVTRGRGGMARMALGSVADKVIRSARMPVLTFRPQ